MWKRIKLAFYVFYTTLRYGYPRLPGGDILSPARKALSPPPYETLWRLSLEYDVTAYAGDEPDKCVSMFKKAFTHEDVRAAAILRNGKVRQVWPQGYDW